MAAQAKFLFDSDFGGNAGREDQKAAALADAEARGYRNGLSAAEAQARTEAERRSAAALERISQLLQSLVMRFSDLERKLEGEAVEVAVAVARKLAPALIAREPLGELAQLVTGCFSELRSAPHIAIRINPAVHGTAQDLLSKIAHAQGFEGRLIVLGDEAVAPGDCRLEWADGGVVRDSAATSALIEDVVARYVAAQPGNGNSEG